MQIGSYEIERELGRGGFGVVYVGIDRRLGRRAAVKQLLPELSTRRDIVERFFNEAKAAASIDHPSIVEIYDVGWHSDGSAYFAMKLLEGESLGRRVRRGPLSIGHAATIARQVASALVATHAAGIVHRDLKPDNIVLVPDEEITIGERAVILDFGIAKLGTAGTMTQTRSGMMMGTPGYMSPEQCRGAGEVDHRTDIYALGCILFEMLTGRTPFVGEGPGEVMGMHQFVEPPLLCSLRPDAPSELEALVARLLAKKLDQRMQQISELPPALGSFATGGRMHVPSPAASAKLPAAQVDAHAETAVSLHVPLPSPKPLVVQTTLRDTTGERVAPPPPPPRKHNRKAILAIGAGALAVLGVGIAVISSSSTGEPSPAIALAPDAAPPVDAANETSRALKMKECAEIEKSKNWEGLKNCARELDRLGESLGVRYRQTATDEVIAEANLRTLREVETDLDLPRATRLLDAIPKLSVYRNDAVATHDRIKAKLIDREVVAVNAIKADCGKYKARLHDIDTTYGTEIARAVGGEVSSCGTAVVSTRPTRVLPTPQIPPPGCNESAIKAQRIKGNALLAALDYNQATSVFDSLAVCDPSAHEQAYIAACHAGLFPVAKRHFAALANKQGLAKICLAHNFDPRDAPQAPATTKADVERVIGALAVKVRECGATHAGRGRIELTILLGPTGLRSATASPISDAGKCVELAARAATFPPWPSGLATFRKTYELGTAAN